MSMGARLSQRTAGAAQWGSAMKKKDDAKLLKLASRLLELLASDAYEAGDGFEFLIVEEDIGDCLERLPLPQSLKQVRGAIYRAKGKNEVKDKALRLVTERASLAPKLADDVALYILSCTHDSDILDNLQQRQELSDSVRAAAKKQATR